MRVLFLFFLLVNAAYFYMQSEWFEAQQGPIILKKEMLPDGVDRLSLLRERGLGASTTKTTKNVGEARRPAPPKEAVSKPVIPKVITSKTEPKEEKPQPERVKSTSEACFTLGPFKKPNVASRAAEAISALGVTVKKRQSSQRKPRGYWVFLPPLKSYSAARKLVKAMQKKGLKDLFIMGKGNRKNAVSLGLFKRKSAAEERFQQIKKMGFKVEMETQYRVSKQTWLDMGIPGDRTSTVADLTEMVEQYSGTSMSQRKCQ